MTELPAMSKTPALERNATLVSLEKNQLVLEKQEIEVEEVQVQDEEGGLHGWMTVAGGWCAQFVGIGHANAFGVYEDFYKENYLSNESSSAIAWIGSTQLAMLFGMGLIAGPLFDKGHFQTLVYSSAAFYILCNFLLSITKPHHFYQVFLSQGIGMGLAMGMMYVPTFGLIGHHFHTRRRAFAMGIASTGSAIGGIVHPIMLNNLINAGGNAFGSGGTEGTFGRAIRINAGMNAGLLGLCILLMRTKKVTGGVKPKVNMGAFFREPEYILVTFGCFLATFGLFFPVVYVQLFSATKGISQSLSFYTLSILNAASTLGRTFPNLLADRIGSLNMLIPITSGLGALVLGYLGVASLASDAVVTVIFGFFSGGFISLMIPTVASLAKHQGEIGARIGITSAVAGISCLAGPPINGALLTSTFKWSRPIIFSGVCTLGGAGLLILARAWQAHMRRQTLQTRSKEEKEELESGRDGRGSSGASTVALPIASTVGVSVNEEGEKPSLT